MTPVGWLAGAYGLQLVARGAADLVRDRQLGRRRKAKVADHPQGVVRLHGRVLAASDRLCEAPLSGTPCVLAHSLVGDIEGAIVERTTQVPFLLDDGTGTATVIAAPPHVEVAIARAWRRRELESDLDARARALLLPGYTVQERGRRERTIELSEWMVFPGDEIDVVGVAQLEADVYGAATGFRSPPLGLVIRGDAAEPLVLASSDRPSLRRAALRDVGRGVALAAAALGLVVF
jgi:hypothetical protein